MILLGIVLDSQTYKKMKEFAVLNKISYSEIARVLLKKSPIKIDARDTKAVQNDAKQKGRLNTLPAKLLLSESLDLKLRKMSLENNTSFSEIVRCLINNADFNSFTFRTKGEVILQSKGKQKK